MTQLTRITFSLLFVLVESISTKPQCYSNHTKLLLLGDVRHDTSYTLIRIQNIASHYISRAKDGLIKFLDISLVDPFQEKTFFNQTSVTSSDELTSALEQINEIYSNSDDDKESVNNKSQLSLAFDHLDKIVNEQDTKGKVNTFVVVLLSSCHGNCQELSKFSDLQNKTNSMFKLIFLFDNSLYKGIKLINNNNYNKYVRNDLVFIEPDDDFATYNPVNWVLCAECTKCWTKYFFSENGPSSYRIELLDTPISWSKARTICDSQSSSLPAIETEDELQFLKEFLQNFTIKTDDVSGSLMRNNVIISISLFKKRGLQHNNFIWLNLRPFNLEVNFESSEDRRERCGAVTFLFKGLNQSDGMKWKAFNCDESITKILVCEMERGGFLDTYEVGARILATSRKRKNGNMYSMLDQLVEMNNLKLNESKEVFYCHDDYETTILYGFVCDGAKDCINGRDELYCPTLFQNVKESKKMCITQSTAGKYDFINFISPEEQCNMIQDCPDNSDEQGCDGCLGRQCEDGTCVPSHWLSRDRGECSLFIEINRKWYLNISYPCIGHCSGFINFQHEITFCDINMEHSSERQTLHVNTTNVDWAPKCLYMRGSDGSTTGCHNNRHLRDCRTFQCPEGFLKCPDSYCVPVYNFGDKLNDCPYGEDEVFKWSNFGKIDNIFKCLKSFIIVHQVHLCDGLPQCPFGKDESYCNMSCPPGFNCHSQAVGVANHTLVAELKSLNIFDPKTKYLNLSGVDLSKVNVPFLLPNLLEIHASYCKLDSLDKIFDKNELSKNIHTVNVSYNKIKEILNYGTLYLFTNLQFLNLSNNKDLSKIEPLGIYSQVLHTIDLSFTKISVFEIFALENVKSVRSLNLYKTNIIQIGSLISIKRLEYFNLQKTKLSTENIAMILKSVSVSSSLYVDHFKYCCPQIVGAGTPEHACHAPSEAFSSCEDLLSDVLKRSLLWLVAGVSLAGNIIVITYRLFYDRGAFKKGYGVFVTNLSVSDCVMGVYLLIIASTDVLYRDEYVLHESDWRHSYLCQAAGFLATLSCETSTFLVFLITLDRYLVIRFPFGDHRFTKLGLVLSIVFVWIIGFILASVPLMYPEWIINSSNGMCLGLPLGTSQNLGWPYSFGIFICLNFILFVLIASGQMFIFGLISSSYKFEMTNVQSVSRRIQEINVAKQLFLVVLSNFLCWFPICILGFLTLTGRDVSPDIYAWLVVFVMPLNAAINPMIYTIPVMYSKWRNFKAGETTSIRRRANQSGSFETKV